VALSNIERSYANDVVNMLDRIINAFDDSKTRDTIFLYVPFELLIKRLIIIFF